MATKAKRHTHKYMRVDIGYMKIWKCALPDCTHHMPKNLEALVLGRNSICWGCGEVFVLDEHSMKNDMPQCYDCQNGVKKEAEIEVPFNIDLADLLTKDSK